MPSKTEWVSVIVTEADGSQHPGKIVPVAKYDMNRPGILSNGEFFPGEGAQVPQVDAQGRPVEVVSRAVRINCSYGAKAIMKVVPCADIMVNYGSGKHGIIERMKFGVLEKKNVPIGGAVPLVCYYELAPAEVGVEVSSQEAEKPRSRR
jgi:hypothetical protein